MKILDIHKDIENLMVARFGGGLRLDGGQILNERSHVARFAVLDGPSGCPETVIAKGWRTWEDNRYEPDDPSPGSPGWLLFNDWAGLQFLTEVLGEGSPAPRFYAGDREAGFFVMADIQGGHDPAQTLLGDDPGQAKEQMIALTRALGQMHAATNGEKPVYDRLRTGLGPLPDDDKAQPQGLVNAFIESLNQLGLAPQAGLQGNLDHVVDKLIDPGPFLAYTHCDPCPDNWRVVDGEMRLFDFEASRFGHALFDGVYGRIHFPSCWCVNRFPPEIPDAMEKVYRAELSKGCPEAADDELFHRAVVEMCAFWILATCNGNKPLLELMEEDGDWGISTIRQRVLLRGAIFAGLTAQHGHLQALGETVGRLVEFLRSRWPADADQMPFYPAFR